VCASSEVRRSTGRVTGEATANVACGFEGQHSTRAQQDDHGRGGQYVAEPTAVEAFLQRTETAIGGADDPDEPQPAAQAQQAQGAEEPEGGRHEGDDGDRVASQELDLARREGEAQQELDDEDDPDDRPEQFEPCLSG
jgi:hypothetical protein